MISPSADPDDYVVYHMFLLSREHPKCISLPGNIVICFDPFLCRGLVQYPGQNGWKAYHALELEQRRTIAESFGEII